MACCGLGVVLTASAGCGVGLPRLVRKGQLDKARAQAARARVEPTGRRARALAAALAADGEVQRARAVLLRDFRKGADLASLRAAAALELEQGWDGSAALHLARLDVLDGTALRGDRQACALFERRAAAALEVGDGALAWRDVARVDRLCPDEGARRRGLRARVIAAERANRPGIRAGRVQGVMADDVTLQTRAQTPEALVARLRAEARGELGPVMLTDHELRAALAGRGWGWLEPAVRALPSGWAAYVRLRVGGVIPLPDPQLPAVSGVAASELARGLSPQDVDLGRVAAAQARGELPAGALWRAFWRAEDPSSAELVLSLGAVGGPPAEVAAASTPSADAVGRPAMGGASDLDDVLVWAILRDRSGDMDAALHAVREALRRAFAAGDPRAWPRTRAVTWRALADGAPLRALAVLDVADGPDTLPLREAIAAALALGEAACGAESACLDPASRGSVTRVMGGSWVARAWAGLRQVGAYAVAPGPMGCPAELGPEQPVGRALRRRGPGRGAAVRAAVEGDVLLACRARWLAAVLARHPVEAQSLARVWEVEPALGWSQHLAAAAVAWAAGWAPRARAHARAAAESAPDPGAAWAQVVRLAEARGDGDMVLEALRSGARPEPWSEPAHRRWVLGTLRHGAQAADPTPAAQAAWARAVAEYVRGGGEDTAWARRERLVAQVLAAPWCSPQAAGRLRDALVPPDARSQHGRAHARLLARSRGEPAAAPGRPDPFVSNDTYWQVALEGVIGGRAGPSRTRGLIAAVVTAPPVGRVRAARALLDAMGRDRRARQRIAERLIAQPAAVTPEGRRVPALVDLPRELAWLAPELAPVEKGDRP